MKQDQLDIRCLRTPCDDRTEHSAEAPNEALSSSCASTPARATTG